MSTDASPPVAPAAVAATVDSAAGVPRLGPKHGINVLQASIARLVRSVLRLEPPTLEEADGPGSTHHHHITVEYDASKGYNNLLFRVRVEEADTHLLLHDLTLKVCGRFWQRVKTETEVGAVALVAGALSDDENPAAAEQERQQLQRWRQLLPTVLAWDSGTSFWPARSARLDGYEHILFATSAGSTLAAEWKGMVAADRVAVVRELGGFLGAVRRRVGPFLLKTSSGGEGRREDGSQPRLLLGNLEVVGGAGDVERFEELAGRVRVSTAVDGGGGPWASYAAYAREKLRSAIEQALRDARLAAAMGGVVAERAGRLAAALEKQADGDGIEEEELVFGHHDFAARNVLVERVAGGDDGGGGGGSGWRVSAVLDWEWAGPSPPDFDFAAGHDFLRSELQDEDDAADGGRGHDAALATAYFGALEAQGAESPRTTKNSAGWRERRLHARVLEGIAPWYLVDVVVATAEEEAQVAAKVGKAKAAVEAALDELGY
ncbi:hypothetical protein HK405_013033 [Cladochytrium tenue]|nr:hypothetical protein HK405_013033 [Cladochytrium tenue]